MTSEDCEKERKKIKRATQEINDRDRFLSRLLSGCKTRALKNNIPFDLTKEQLIELFEKQNGKCALSNLEMQTVIKILLMFLSIELNQGEHILYLTFV